MTQQTHNLVVVLMHEKDIGYQAAIEQAAKMVRDTIVRFETHRAQLPSWGPERDEMVAKYVQGLQDWMIGNACWSFETERYFGSDGAKTKETLRVPLLPKLQALESE